MNHKTESPRSRRIRRSRSKILELGVNYLSVHRTSKHITAQIFSARGSKVIASASSLESGIRQMPKESGKIGVAAAVGKLIAERAKTQGVTKAAFDRSGYQFHGRIKALAEAASANGLTCC